MKKSIRQINENLSKIDELESEIKQLSRPIEDDLYFDVIRMSNNMSNNMSNITHIINGISFELNKKHSFGFYFKNNKYELFISGGSISNNKFDTKEELFEYFFLILKEDFPQHYRELKIKRLLK